MFRMIPALGLALLCGCAITAYPYGPDAVVDVRPVEDAARNAAAYLATEASENPFPEPLESGLDLGELLEAMRQRHPELAALQAQGCLGQDNRGYLAVQECPALDEPAARNAAQRLVAAENHDRKAFYRGLARYHESARVTLSVVERVFAWRYLQDALPGAICQLPPAGEHFDRFKTSAPGQNLGEACEPGAWVTIP
jgi:uncharacterized protein YdbL (DUF1318 family)